MEKLPKELILKFLHVESTTVCKPFLSHLQLFYYIFNKKNIDENFNHYHLLWRFEVMQVLNAELSFQNQTKMFSEYWNQISAGVNQTRFTDFKNEIT